MLAPFRRMLLDGISLGQVPNSDLCLFKAGMRRRVNRMLEEMWGPVLSLPAIPGSDLILEPVLERMIARS